MHRREYARALPALRLRPLVAVVRRIAFWLAIALPTAYGPLLYGGVDGRTASVLGGLVVLNLVCLVLGHEHTP